MIKIKGGKYQMGSEGYGEFESPIHLVEISDFLLDETLITNSMFDSFVSQTGYLTTAEKIGAAWGYDKGVYKHISGLSWKSHYSSERADHPVVLISWYDANEYCNWAQKRLPTEAEWEYAARGGNNEWLYPWGNDEPNGTQSNFAKNPYTIPPTTPVRTYQPNFFGLYDMVGNIWQWCNDWFNETYYASGNNLNPTGPSAGQSKVRRGGAWNVIQSFRLRCANRGAMLPESYTTNIGFRCAKSII